MKLTKNPSKSSHSGVYGSSSHNFNGNSSPHLTSEHSSFSSTEESLADSLELILPPYVDNGNRVIRLYRLHTSELCGLVQTQRRQCTYIPQAKILNPLGGNFRSF